MVWSFFSSYFYLLEIKSLQQIFLFFIKKKKSSIQVIAKKVRTFQTIINSKKITYKLKEKQHRQLNYYNTGATWKYISFSVKALPNKTNLMCTWGCFGYYPKLGSLIWSSCKHVERESKKLASLDSYPFLTTILLTTFRTN